MTGFYDPDGVPRTLCSGLGEKPRVPDSDAESTETENVVPVRRVDYAAKPVRLENSVALRDPSRGSSSDSGSDGWAGFFWLIAFLLLLSIAFGVRYLDSHPEKPSPTIHGNQ